MCALGCLCGRTGAGEVGTLAYRFTVGNTRTYRLNILADVVTVNAVGGATNQAAAVNQTNAQEFIIEETVRRVDQTGSAELAVVFKSAKADVKLKGVSPRDNTLPDTLKYLSGRSVTAYVMADGKVLAVDGIVQLLSALKNEVKDPLLMAVIEQDFSEDFFKELLQNLYPQLPPDAAMPVRDWETQADILLPRTQYKLRVLTQSNIKRAEADTARIGIRGKVTVLPVDPDEPLNPALPTVEVLASNISGEAVFSTTKGSVLESQLVNDLTLRNTMQLRLPNQRGPDIITQVVKKSRTTISVKLVK